MINKILKFLIIIQIVKIKVKYIDFQGNDKVGNLEVNIFIRRKTKRAFKELYKIRFPLHNITLSNLRSDENIIMVNDSTVYNYRNVYGTNRLSNHSFGYAIDINPKNNPAKPSKISHVYDENITKGIINGEVINIFKKYGFLWGGEIFGDFWDSHHFEVRMNKLNKFLKKMYQRTI